MELYNETEIIRGRLYRYDPDFDCWYPVPEAESAVSKWAWLVLCVILAILAVGLEYRHLLV